MRSHKRILFLPLFAFAFFFAMDLFEKFFIRCLKFFQIVDRYL